MNSNFKIVSVAVLMIIYCFAIGIVRESRTQFDVQSNSSTSQEKFFSDISTTLFSHTTQFEGSISNFNNLPNPSFKNPFSGLWTITRCSEQLLLNTFAQYTNSSRNFLIQHRKTDIIFPFHYFW